MQTIIRHAQKYINIKFDKVKSHQGGPEEDLPFEAILNNKADELAVWIKNNVQGPTKNLIPGERMGIGVMKKDNIFIKDIKKTVKIQIK